MNPVVKELGTSPGSHIINYAFDSYASNNLKR